MDFDAKQYIDLFFQDTEEHLEVLSDALLELENNPGSQKAISELFRVAHTLKSSSAMVGFDHISNYTHKLEDELSKIRDGEVSATETIIDSLFECFDILKAMLNNLQDNETEARKNETKGAAKKSLSRLQELVEGVPEEEAPKKKAERIKLSEADRVRIQDHRLAGERIFEMVVFLEEQCRMPSVRAYLVYNNVAQLGKIILAAPDVAQNENAEVEGSFTLVVGTNADEDELRHQADVDEVSEIEIRDVTDVEQFEITQPSSEPAPAEEPAGGEEAPKEEAQENVQTSFDRREDRTTNRTVRVDIEKLDVLLNLAGELVINRGRAIEQISHLSMNTSQNAMAEELMENVQEQGRLINQLQEAVMSTRMVPIGQVFSRFRRVVRDLSKENNKKVQLDINGEETELDKKIIDQIGDPITHMVRNSVDHGIETPEDRVQAGKADTGILRFDAYHEGNNIHIEVQDDGRGLNMEAIKNKALQNGVVSADALEQMSDRDICQLIFLPGFSTAKKVTDVSGRGVGMDVVKNRIDELGGTVEIETKAGQGTKFTIKLPLTLAIIQALLVDVGSEIFAIPIANVKETIRVRKDEIFSVEGAAEVIRLRDNVVPVLRLNEILETEYTNSSDRLYIAVVNYEQKQVGLVVDRMVNEQEIVVKAMEGEMKKLEGIAGASIMGDGKVSLILDVASLVDYAMKRDAAPLAARENKRKEVQDGSVPDEISAGV